MTWEFNPFTGKLDIVGTGGTVTGGNIDGSGSAGYIVKWVDGDTITSSIASDDGSRITSPALRLQSGLFSTNMSSGVTGLSITNSSNQIDANSCSIITLGKIGVGGIPNAEKLWVLNSAATPTQPIATIKSDKHDYPLLYLGGQAQRPVIAAAAWEEPWTQTGSEYVMWRDGKMGWGSPQDVYLNRQSSNNLQITSDGTSSAAKLSVASISAAYITTSNLDMDSFSSNYITCGVHLQASGDISCDGEITVGNQGGAYVNLSAGALALNSYSIAFPTNSVQLGKSLIGSTTAGQTIWGGHDDFVDFVANEHIDWTNATQSMATSANISSSTATMGSARIGTGSTYANFDTGGNLRFYSGSLYYVPADSYSFKATVGQYGFYFNSATEAQYQFINNTGYIVSAVGTQAGAQAGIIFAYGGLKIENLATSLGSAVNTTISGLIHVDSATASAKPMIYAKQDDLDQAYIDYRGSSSAGTGSPISTYTAGNSIQGFVRVQINGTSYWMPYYDAPTS